MSKTTSHISELRHAKFERRYVKGIKMKPLRKAVARAERREIKQTLRDWELNHS